MGAMVRQLSKLQAQRPKLEKLKRTECERFDSIAAVRSILESTWDEAMDLIKDEVLELPLRRLFDDALRGLCLHAYELLGRDKDLFPDLCSWDCYSDWSDIDDDGGD